MQRYIFNLTKKFYEVYFIATGQTVSTSMAQPGPALKSVIPYGNMARGLYSCSYCMAYMSKPLAQ